jgi:DNA-binding NtrC family response regulator
MNSITLTSSRATRILLVDDEENILHSLERVFVKRGYHVLKSVSPIAALGMLEIELVDVVVSDEKMPEQRGTEFLAHVAKRFPACVRIMLTGESDVGVVLRAVNEGHVHHFFLKPLPAEVLATEIQRVVEYRAMEENSRRLLDLCREQAKQIEALNSASTKRSPEAREPTVLDTHKDDDVQALLADVERRLGKLPSGSS